VLALFFGPAFRPIWPAASRGPPGGPVPRARPAAPAKSAPTAGVRCTGPRLAAAWWACLPGRCSRAALCRQLRGGAAPALQRPGTHRHGDTRGAPDIHRRALVGEPWPRGRKNDRGMHRAHVFARCLPRAQYHRGLVAAASFSPAPVSAPTSRAYARCPRRLPPAAGATGYVWRARAHRAHTTAPAYSAPNQNSRDADPRQPAAIAETSRRPRPRGTPRPRSKLGRASGSSSQCRSRASPSRRCC